MYKITDRHGRIIYTSESDMASGAAEIAEQLEELICEDVTEGRPSYYIVCSVEDPAERDGFVDVGHTVDGLMKGGC